MPLERVVVVRTQNKRSGPSLTLGRGGIVPKHRRVSLYRPEETTLRYHRQPRYLIVLGAMALSAFALSMSLALSVPAAMASGPANAEANELVRLINGERAYLGKAPLRTDTFLASKARDGAIACPNNASLVMYGRAKDFAVYGYPSNSHLLRLCPTYTSMDAMASWGYKGSRGEITALNGGYGTGKVAYTYGCTPSVRTCPGSTTSTYHTTDIAMWDWTSSATHYAIIIGSYDRVGCGAWIGSNGAFYYDCMFSRGGPSHKTASKPAGGRRGAGSRHDRAAVHRPGATLYIPEQPVEPTAAPTVEPTAAPSDVVEGLQATEPASPAPDAALGGTAQGGPQNGPPSGGIGPAGMSRDLSVAAGAITAIFSLLYGLLMSVKRRRPRNQLAS